MTLFSFKIHRQPSAQDAYGSWDIMRKVRSLGQRCGKPNRFVGALHEDILQGYFFSPDRFKHRAYRIGRGHHAQLDQSGRSDHRGCGHFLAARGAEFSCALRGGELQRCQTPVGERVYVMKTTDSSARSPPSGDEAIAIDPNELGAIREQMVKFATLQLGDRQLAEDAVQEALLGALKNASSFTGKAALKTWVFAILKHKITDILRHKHRHVQAQQLMGDADEEADFTELFNARGMWESDERPATWGNPYESLHEKQFWTVFETCLEGLPGQQGRVFMMREYVGLDAVEICSAVGITSTNLNVMLHRARLRLRECLENRWFAKGGPSC